ncbi:hypothetical protein N665_0820s0010 [Sinapis alba]|nr:hypothetical protein N665_0820s0010 [Sinapis alba]
MPTSREKGTLLETVVSLVSGFLGVEHALSGTAECFSLIEKPLNHKVTWMMTMFSSFGPEKAHHSNEFVVGNRKWRIQVHPRGFKEGRDMGWLGEEPGVSHGFSDFMPLEKLDEPYLVNDKFYVGVEFEFISVTNTC